MLIPLVILAIGAIFAGFLFKDLFIGHGEESNFWSQSIKFLEPLSTEHPPTWFLLLTPCLVLLSIPIAYYFFVKNKQLPDQIANNNKPLYNFLINKWYFDELYEVIFIKPCKKIGLFLWKFCDGKLIDGFGPDGISSFIKKPAPPTTVLLPYELLRVVVTATAFPSLSKTGFPFFNFCFPAIALSIFSLIDAVAVAILNTSLFGACFFESLSPTI